MAQLIGVVLAGEEGRRRDRPRGARSPDGIPAVERAARALSPLCGSVLVSIASGSVNPAPKYPTIEAAPPAGRGPLAEIDAAMAVTGTADLLVLACEYRSVETDLLRVVVQEARPGDDVVFVTDRRGVDHPLVGLWRRASSRVVREALEYGTTKVRGILADLVTRRLGPVDLPGTDLEAALANEPPSDEDAEWEP